MKAYEVKLTHVIHRQITGLVFAESKDQAIDKAKEWEFEDSDEDSCPEEGYDSFGHRVVLERELTEEELENLNKENKNDE